MEIPTVTRGAARICGVIVTYHPDPQTLGRLIRAVGPQLGHLVIVDNGSGFDFAPLLEQHAAELVALGDNYGIARAQNVGIDHARRQGADHVLLMDQDSLPAPDMVERLMAAVVELGGKDLPVAAVGPCYLDHRQGETAPFVYLEGLKLRRRTPAAGDTVVEADFLIASGCLIPIASLDKTGSMAEELFIDYVDIEWGLRARNLGYLSYGVPAAHMEHSLGDEWIEFRGRRIPVHSPLRHYYHVRNAVWLCRRPWISAGWRLVLAWRLVRQFLFFTFKAPHGASHARMMAVGLWHGLANRIGRK